MIEQNPNNTITVAPKEVKKTWLQIHTVLGILFLFVVAAAIVSGIYYCQTVREIPTIFEAPQHREWKTYTSAEYGFEIQYPSALSVKEFEEIIDHNESTRGIIFKEGQLDIFALEINRSIVSGGAPMVETETKVLQAVNTMITKSKGFSYQNQQKIPNSYYLNYGFEASTHKFSILVVADSMEDLNINESKIDKILSTFKFISSDSLVCIQVIQRAKNPETGEVRDFPTPCDVPKGWVLVSPFEGEG